MKIVTFNWVVGTRQPTPAPQAAAPAEDPETREQPEGEDDGIGILPEGTAPAVVPQVEEITTPIALDAGQIRTFYPRKDQRVGTRIILRGGTAYPVTATFEQVKAAIAAAMG